MMNVPTEGKGAGDFKMDAACGERKRTCFAVKAGGTFRELWAAFHGSGSLVPHSQPCFTTKTSGSSCLLAPPSLPLNRYLKVR